MPDPEQTRALKATVEHFNEACNWIARECFARREANQFHVRKFAYREARERFGLSSQMAQHAIKCVCDVYKRDKAKRPKFRKHAAIVYDQRTMSFKGIDRVSILSLEGRVIVPFVLGKYQRERFTLARGQADLVLRHDGKWFLLVTVDVPEAAPIPTTDFLGVDFGVVNIATTEDGEEFSGKTIDATRRHYGKRRAVLGRAASARRRNGKRPKNIRRALKRIKAKEARFRRHENHHIAKSIVGTAKGTNRGIGLEDLQGIRNRVTARGGEQRNRLSGWAFFQLRSFIEYKARLAGVPVITVDPRNTSRSCPECGHCEKANRKSQSEFECRACGYCSRADLVAARNIGSRARVYVTAPMHAGLAPSVEPKAAGL
ncbi:MAG: RNA-guided endonuclease InsQ/TnpB family protein [Phycisphaerales bacterium]